MSDLVDISHVTDRVALLRALWNASKPAKFFTGSGILPPEFDESEAERAISPSDGWHGSIDYFCGRAIKTKLSTDEVDPSGYDRDNGPGAFRRVVDSLTAPKLDSYASQRFKDGFGFISTGAVLRERLVDAICAFEHDDDPEKIHSTMQFWQFISDLDSSGLSADDRKALLRDVAKAMTTRVLLVENPLFHFVRTKLSAWDS